MRVKSKLMSNNTVYLLLRININWASEDRALTELFVPNNEKNVGTWLAKRNQ